jgi:hypothetical protein
LRWGCGASAGTSQIVGYTLLFKWDEFGCDNLELDGTAKEGETELKAGKAEVPFE